MELPERDKRRGTERERKRKKVGESKNIKNDDNDMVSGFVTLECKNNKLWKDRKKRQRERQKEERN